ncbi:MAG: Holliday junction resolvase RuvX [Hyphomicrobiales bacterium]|nr:Holliday junction resolvase RuvX [Hyphomicrobiales bacterium]OQW84247.1 MAG: Holliday junction resolvase RuvX [Proteobacteria bacterium ST_bin15]
MSATVVTLEELARNLARPSALVGLDLGTKTIGVAVSDVTWRFSTPLTVIKRVKFSVDAAALLTLCAERQAGALILGLPLNMDGSEGPRAQATRAFQRSLSQLTPLPIAFQDERLSTHEAERALIERDMSRKKRAAVIDAHAAAVILQGALDRLAVLRQTGGNNS